VAQMAGTFGEVVISFFKKPHIFLLLVFIFLYRAGEGQVMKVGPLFLVSSRYSGGLGLSSTQVGSIYFFVAWGVLLGSIVGGLFAASLGLKRALTWLLLMLTMPLFAYVYLSQALPTNLWVVAAALGVEQFGYGFGFVGIILLMMQEIAPGKFQTAHYAFANSLMNFGFIVPGAMSGWIQSKLGYQHFFIWTLFCALPALILSRFIPMQAGEHAEPAPGATA
jgi:PAT family beta-lactamase induction signal transducer AmpG